MKREFNLVYGTSIPIIPSNPIIGFDAGYLWIGNNVIGHMACYGTLAGKKDLMRLAKLILKFCNKKKEG